MTPAAVRLLAILRARLSRVATDRSANPTRAGDSLAVYVEDSAQIADTIAALDEVAAITADPMGEVRAWLVADLHAMGRPAMADGVAAFPASVGNLAIVCSGLMPEVRANLSPRTRAALGIGGGT